MRVELDAVIDWPRRSGELVADAGDIGNRQQLLLRFVNLDTQPPHQFVDLFQHRFIGRPRVGAGIEIDEAVETERGEVEAIGPTQLPPSLFATITPRLSESTSFDPSRRRMRPFLSRISDPSFPFG